MEELQVSASDFVYEHDGKLRDAYKIGNKLGEGAYSSVRSLKHRITGEHRAVKVIRKSSLKTEEERGIFFNEVAILRELDHPNIVKLYEFYQDDKHYYMITEYCNGGELFDKILNDGCFSEHMAADSMRELLSVVLYMHDRHIAHRDIKPENFLINVAATGSMLKAIDFGTAQRYLPGQPMSYKIGTAYYIAPEVLREEYTEKCDIWSAGIVLYIMLCGYPPFSGEDDAEIIEKVKSGVFSFDSHEWNFISDDVKGLIRQMLTVNPSRRPSARECLDHHWMENASREPLNPELVGVYMNNLKSFKSEQMLQKATLSFIGSQLTTKEEREEMIELFKSLDTDSNGTLSKEELRVGFVQIFGEDIDQEMDRIMQEIDADHSGTIEYNEFVTAALSRQQLLSRERLFQAFSMFDSDGSGKISAEELKNMLGKYHSYDESLWEKLIRSVDENGDGEIDFEEFVNMMLGVTNH